MHELNPFDAQRIDRRQDDRGIYVGLLREGGMTPPASDTVWPLTDADMRELRKPLPACTANACSSGRKPCPCPDACRVAEGSRMDFVWRVLDRVPVRHFWIGYAVVLLACASGLYLIFG